MTILRLLEFDICSKVYSFQVMIQRHNRRMSFSLYISALAVSDTIVLLIGEYAWCFLYCVTELNWKCVLDPHTKWMIILVEKCLLKRYPQTVNVKLIFTGPQTHSLKTTHGRTTVFSIFRNRKQTFNTHSRTRKIVFLSVRSHGVKESIYAAFHLKWFNL